MRAFLLRLPAAACAALLLAMAPVRADAAFAPFVSAAPGAPGFIDFAVGFDEPFPVITLEMEITLPAGVFDTPAAVTELAVSSSRPADWETAPAMAYWPSLNGTVALLGVITNNAFTPIEFQPGESAFLFSLPLLAGVPAGETYGFSFMANYDEAPLGEGFQGGGQFTTVIPEPSTWALLLAGIVGFGTIVRRRVG